MNPVDVLADLGDTVARLAREGLAGPEEDFVTEALLPLPELTVVPDPDPEPPAEPILVFGPDNWTHVSGDWSTVDSRGREAVVVGEGMWPFNTVFTAPCPIDPGSDWTLVVRTTGEVNEHDPGLDLVTEGHWSDGINMRFSQAYGLGLGRMFSGSTWIANTQAWDPNRTTYVAIQEAGVRTVRVRGISGNFEVTGAGDGALGTGTLTITLPFRVPIFALHVYDFAWDGAM